MNERIRELAEQAFNEANNGSINNIKIPKEFVEKFAELIVLECMKICQNHPSIIFKNEWDADVVSIDIVHRLESHFGVEE
jgi:hypothetical protein